MTTKPDQDSPGKLPVFQSPGIILRRVDYMDYDLIIDFLTREKGKVTAIAKNAKKSKKRFAGILELFARLDAVFVDPRQAAGLTLLKEANLADPFIHVRLNMEKTAYAGYWCEMINRWVESGGKQAGLFELLDFVLTALDRGTIHREVLSILFQTRFLDLAGMTPCLNHCRHCRCTLESMPGSDLIFDIAGGGIVCKNCHQKIRTGTYAAVVSKGTVKQVAWLMGSDLSKAERIYFSEKSRNQAMDALERFVAFHLTAEIKSLKVLRRVRRSRKGNEKQ
ncbi:MAG: DNA repair protein RecO [Thermodesulfobacteriota bacterium]|nr:DNA repair protein RecO [Thermodesulfobacteriota bacterium]